MRRAFRTASGALVLLALLPVTAGPAPRWWPASRTWPAAAAASSLPPPAVRLAARRRRPVRPVRLRLRTERRVLGAAGLLLRVAARRVSRARRVRPPARLRGASGARI